MMTASALRVLCVSFVSLALLAACDSEPSDPTTTDGDLTRFVAPEPAEDSARDVLSTRLELDVTAFTGKAIIQVAPSTKTGLSFEIGDLEIESVKLVDRAQHTLKTSVVDGSVAGGALQKRRLDIGVPAGTTPVSVVVSYTFSAKKKFDGWMPSSNVSFLWPYFCSNLYPCHSNPDDGSTFEIAVTGVPSGQIAVYPESIAFDAPTYMPAIAVGAFSYVELGTTTKGTHVGYYTLPAESGGGVVAATSKLVDVFDWYETTIGKYQFGPKVAAVDAHWGPGAFGGMEHHPYFHVASEAFGDENTHAHEAAHAWFGDGVRIKCWEDFVLSEGTVTYLAARATEVVRGTAAGEAVWADYRSQLAQAVAGGDTKAWPQTCNAIDILTDKLWSSIPYMKGAFFYRAVAKQIGAGALDAILAKFYGANVGKAASMRDMISLIGSESGFDPEPLVEKYLLSLGNPEH